MAFHVFLALDSVPEPWRGSLGASFLSADWQVTVFWSSGLVDRPSDCLYVRNITLSGCMDRRYGYIHFSSQEWLACHRKTCALASYLEELSPYGSPRLVPPGPWKFSDNLTAWGVPQTETVSSKYWEAYNLVVYSTFINRFHLTHKKKETRAAQASKINLLTYVR